MKDILICLLLLIVLGVLYKLTTKTTPVQCHGLQIIDCGHIVHNGDTVRFTTLPVK